jgi:hypothetical protein
VVEEGDGAFSCKRTLVSSKLTVNLKGLGEGLQIALPTASRYQWLEELGGISKQKKNR